MHCILNYPTEKINANLNMIKGLASKYPDHLIGYSDHTLPDKNMSSLNTAYLLGAAIIEKHFTFCIYISNSVNMAHARGYENVRILRWIYFLCCANV